MAANLPSALIPVLGSAMYWLDRGESLDFVMEKLRTHRDFGHVTEEEFATVLAQATVNREAWENLQAATEATYFSRLFPTILPTSATIGIRVVVDLTFPDGHHEHRTVTVNVRGGMSIQAVLDRITTNVNQGFFNRPGRPTYPSQITGVPSITQLIEGGFDNPSMSL